MRKFTALLLIAVLCFSFFGCTKKVAWRNYYDKENKFSLRIPKDWDVEEELEGAALVLSIPQVDAADQFASNVRMVIEDLPKPVPLNVYYDINREEFRRVFKNMRDVTEGQGMSGLVRYQWIAFNALIGEKIVIRAISCVWINQKRVYILTCVMGLRSAEQAEPLFRKMISSFRLL
jgi:hypothetical protein